MGKARYQRGYSAQYSGFKLATSTFVLSILVYIWASYIVFFFVKMENNNSIKEIKHVLLAFIAW